MSLGSGDRSRTRGLLDLRHSCAQYFSRCHHRIPNPKCLPITTLLNKYTYHKSAKGSPSPYPQISLHHKSMNKLTLNEPSMNCRNSRRAVCTLFIIFINWSITVITVISKLYYNILSSQKYSLLPAVAVLLNIVSQPLWSLLDWSEVKLSRTTGLVHFDESGIKRHTPTNTK